MHTPRSTFVFTALSVALALGCGQSAPPSSTPPDAAPDDVEVATADLPAMDLPAPDDAPKGDSAPELGAPDAPATMCAESMQPCAGSGACCGAMRCEMGLCACRLENATCERDLDCCNAPATGCRGGRCVNVQACALPEAMACAPGAEAPNCCAGGRRCEGLRCCNAPGGSCAGDQGCCGTGRCQMGRCCAPVGGACAAASDCCAGARCTGGRCVAVCMVALGDACTRDSMTPSECCGRGQCALPATGSQTECCLAAGTTCGANDTCCGGSCNRGTCCGDGSGRAACDSNDACCADALCVMPAGGTTMRCEKAPGQACASRFECASEGCTGGRCDRMRVGESCRANADCVSNRCVESVCE